MNRVVCELHVSKAAKNTYKNISVFSKMKFKILENKFNKHFGDDFLTGSSRKSQGSVNIREKEGPEPSVSGTTGNSRGLCD